MSQAAPEQSVLEQAAPEQSVLEQAAPEQSVPEQVVPQPTISDHTPEILYTENAMEIDDSVIDPDAQTTQSSPMEVDQSASDQAQSQSESNTQSSTLNNLQIQPCAPPKPRKQPSPPTRFLDSNVLKGVCEDIADKMIKLISSRSDLSHRESYEKQWRNSCVLSLLSSLNSCRHI